MLAVEVEIDGINYDLRVNEAWVNNKADGKYYGEVVIPESVEHDGTTYSVTRILDLAFEWCSGLTSVTIPNSVTSIGGYAFQYCSGLTSVTIPTSVTSIGDDTFYGCSGLTSVTIPNSVTSIGREAFYGCSGLTSVTIPNSVTSIERSAFGRCSGLTSVTIPNSVTSIGNGAFRYCSGLTEMKVDANNSKYDSREGCNAIIETSSNTLLYGCQTTVIPNSVTSIGPFAFCSCYGLTSITISNSMTSIGEYAFGWCSGLLDVYCYAEKMPSTENNAFNSSNYSNATLHVPAASIESYKAKSPWSGFGNIVALPPFSGEVEINGINYELNGETKQAIVIAKSSGEYSGEVVIPESVVYVGNEYSVTSIGEWAFANCSGLTSITIPNSVTSIGQHAFFDCFGLTSVTIPNSVTSIGGGAFIGCSGLTSVTIGNSVTSIGYGAFEGCYGLTSVTIPNSVESIGWYAFSGCYGLTEMKVDANNSKYDSREGCNAIIETSSNTLISGCQTTVIPNSVTSIRYGAFQHCYGLTSITIPNSVTSIEEDAFSGCTGLTSVTIPNSVTIIGNYAFCECYGLTSVTIGSGMTSIGYGAFRSCSGLQDVYCYAENVPSTESNAFSSSPIADATLHVPAASINNYKATAPWSGFGSIVALPGQYSLTVSSVGYATLYLDYNAEIPEGVEAYVATEVVDSRLKMQKVEGVLPPYTGVIIVAEQGTYTFTESDETPATIEKNLLQGSVTNTYVTAEANTTYYVLSAPDGVVGMYQAKLTDNQFLNNAFKAYLPISNGDLGIFDDEVDSSVEQLSRRLVFDFGEEETSIDEVLTTDKSQKTKDIFDLSGRRVQKAQKGIYIQNGKLMVK